MRKLAIRHRRLVTRMRTRALVGAVVTAMWVIGISAATPWSAKAQELGPLMDRIDRLERDIRTLNVQISRGGTAVPVSPDGTPGPSTGVAPDPGLSRMTARIDGLEQDIRTATGTLERLDHGIRQLTERLDKLVRDIDYRLGALDGRSGTTGTPATAAPAPGTEPSTQGVETKVLAPTDAPSGSLGTVSASAVDAVKAARAAGAPAQGAAKGTAGTQSWSLGKKAPVAGQLAPTQPAPTQTAGIPAGSSLPAGTVKERYTHALNLLRQTNYDQAEIALKEFIGAHADSSFAGNARYWLGETYYVRADYEQAAQAFFAGYQASPEGAKAPDMLLKLGMALSQLNKKTEACATFTKLIADFPNASPRISSAIDREKKRSKCS